MVATMVARYPYVPTRVPLKRCALPTSFLILLRKHDIKFSVELVQKTDEFLEPFFVAFNF